MRHRFALATVALLASASPQTLVGSGDQALPIRDGRPVVATVGDDVIFLDEFLLQMEPPVDAARYQSGRASQADLELLERLVTVRLLAHEGAAMGLGDLPEIRKQVDVTSRQLLRDVLMERLVKDVTPDAALVESLYKERVQEWRTASVLFSDEAAATAARKTIDSGTPFEKMAAAAVAAKQAKTESDDAFHKQSDYLADIAAALKLLTPGGVSPVVRIGAGFVIVQLVDTRYPEDAAVRAEATKDALYAAQQAVLAKHEEDLRKRIVTVHQDVVDSLDFAAPSPGMAGLLKDTRVVAEIQGTTPLTVADLTDYLRMQFFHGGSDAAAEGKRLNEKKGAGLESTLSRRALNVEAVTLGLDKSAGYIDRINGFEESLVFDAFVQKVIVPENKMREEEVKAYYDAHLSEYSYPGMWRLRSLAFTTRAAAESATEKLRGGADFGWLSANADGQVAKGTDGVLAFDGRPVLSESMPEGVQKALKDARAGDVRLYESPGGPFYVFAVQELVGATPKPYADVREDIAGKMYAEKLKKAIESYAAKLRALTKVDIHLTKAD